MHYGPAIVLSYFERSTEEVSQAYCGPPGPGRDDGTVRGKTKTLTSGNEHTREVMERNSEQWGAYIDDITITAKAGPESVIIRIPT
jgi:hypothetical protein